MTARIGFAAIAMTLLMSGQGRGDAGVVRASTTQNGRTITALTSPPRLRVGSAEVSVLVQDASTGRAILNLPIRVEFWQPDAPERRRKNAASAEDSVNKLLRAASIEFPEAGSWCVAVFVGEDEQPLRFDVEVDSAPPEWLSMAGWLTLPFVAVALFAIHRRLERRRNRNTAGRSMIESRHTTNDVAPGGILTHLS